MGATRSGAEWRHARIVVASLPSKWQHSMSSGALITATDTQLIDLKLRMEALVAEWSEACIRDQNETPDKDRWPVRVIARVFPATLGDVAGA